MHRIALVGIGKIARDQHVPAIADSPDFTLAATASRNAGVEGAERFTDLASLLTARPDVPAISLCTPPQVRFADACRAIEAGRHVMLEKPPGATLAEVQDLTDRAESAGVTLFATWHSRHAHVVPAARDWLRGKSIREVRITWREDVRRWHPGQEWVWQPGGLGVFDPGINALSILTAIFPRPLHLATATLEFPENRGTPIGASLEFSDHLGTRVTAEFDWRQEGPQTWDIAMVTDQGRATLSDGGARLTVDGTMVAEGPDREYPGLYARFAELIASGHGDVDIAPLRHVADAFMLGQRVTAAPFDW